MKDLIAEKTSGLFVEVGKVIEHMKAQQERIADLERALDDVCKDRDDYESHMIKLDKLLCVDPEGADREQIVATVEKLWHRNVELIEASAPAVVQQPIGYISNILLTERRKTFERDGAVMYSQPAGMYTTPVFATPQAADTDKVREAILSILPNPPASIDKHESASYYVDFRAGLKAAAELVGSMAAQAPVREVPEGWQLVPVEPTEEMLKAIVGGADSPGSFLAAAIYYQKVLAASPLPAAPVRQEIDL